MRAWTRLLHRRPRQSHDGHSAELTGDPARDAEAIAQRLGHPPDLVTSPWDDTPSGSITVLYLSTLVNEESVQQSILAPLLQDGEPALPSTGYPSQAQIPSGKLGTVKRLGEVIDALLAGRAVLLRRRNSAALTVKVKGPPHRQLTESPLNRTTRGSRLAFIEDIDINVSLVRRQLQDPHLRFDEVTLGRRTHTRVLIGYIEDIVRPAVLRAIKERIAKIDIDGLSTTGYIEQFIEDHPWSPFPQMIGTESPVKATSGLLEGQVVILVAGSPFALIGPAVFTSFLQAQEDYNERFWLGNMYRLLRYMALFISWTLPPLYVALTTYNPELLPLQIATAIARSRSDVPFPPIIEALLFELVLDLLREMGLRLPSPLGQTVGVVGGIVLGDASIRTGLVSPAMLVVVVVTTISAFVTPVYTMAQSQRLVRLPLLILSSVFGVYGLTVGLLMLLTHLCSLNSFGIPYLSPFAPLRFADLKDSFFRAPLWMLRSRPTSMSRPSASDRQDGDYDDAIDQQ